jgi:hypothetical protein
MEDSGFVHPTLDDTLGRSIREGDHSKEFSLAREDIQISVEVEVKVLVVSEPDDVVFGFPGYDRAGKSLPGDKENQAPSENDPASHHAISLGFKS